jgi:hypothetical protein
VVRRGTVRALTTALHAPPKEDDVLWTIIVIIVIVLAVIGLLSVVRGRA